MKTLFITHHYLSGNSGGSFASRAFINAFAEVSSKITLLYPVKEGEDLFDGINTDVEAIPVAYDIPKFKKLWHLLTGRVHRYFVTAADIAARSHFDLVVFDTSVVSYRIIDLFKKRGSKIIVIHHNYQYEYFRDNTAFPLSLPVLFWCRRYEKQAVRKADLNLTLTGQDIDLLSKNYNYGNGDRFRLLGMFEFRGDRPKTFAGEGHHPVHFAITGNLGDRQSRQSLIPWLKECYPILKEVFPEASLTIAGKNPGEILKERCRELGIRLMDSPKSMDEVMSEADCYICPTSLGGGLKLRIMDGLKWGLPVISHVVSARGYEEFADKGFLFSYSDSDSFRKSLKSLSEGSFNRQEICRAYQDYFSFEAGVHRLERIVSELQPTRRKLLVFHPVIAPYRIDFFNSLTECFDSRICLFLRNLDNQKFDYGEIERQFRFTPEYVVREEMGTFRWARSIWSILSESNADIVYCSEFGLSTIVILLHRFFTRCGYRIVSITDDSYDMVACGNQFTLRHKAAIRCAAPFVDEIQTVEPRVRDWYKAKYGKGLYFPIICDEKIARERQRRALPISERYLKDYNLEGKKVLLYVGRFVALKNIGFAIDAFIKANIKDCVFLLVGGGEMESQLKEKAAECPNVIVAGRFEGDHLYAWYNVACALTLQSTREAFGAVTNEALVAGCKCLVSRYAGSSSLINEGVNGFLVDPGDENDYICKLRLLMEGLAPVSLPLKLKEDQMHETFNELFNKLTDAL